MAGSVNHDAIKHLVDRIPLNSKGAEIGVWKGRTSLEIVKRRQPKELHLVDPWSIEPYNGENEHGSYQDYIDRYTKMVGDDFQGYYDQVHKDVVKTFKPYDNVEIHRTTSTQFFLYQQVQSFDWVYIDADHSYRGCLHDLIRGFCVLRDGGLLFGDDYRGPEHKPGVWRAVSEFREFGFEFERFGDSQYCFTV